MIGTPVIVKHQDVTEENADKLRIGTISNAYFNEPDGWYYCEGIIWDKDAQELINKGWSVSCSYDFLAYNDEGGIENNIEYDKEFTQLNFTHLAIVDNPRYERANIIFNCKIDNFSEEQIERIPKGEKGAGQFTFKGFHGSNNNFEKFSPEKEWHFLSSDFTIAKSYAKPKNGIIYETEIEFKNPFIFEANGNNWGDLNKQGLRTNDIARKAKADGYDGVIIKELKDIGREFPYHKWTNEELDILDKPHDDYIIFNPENIKIKRKNILNNSKEQEMVLLDELKKLITKVENNKENEKMVENEKTDKRKLIDEVGGILKGKVDDEIIKTIMKKMEEASYDESEAGTADNKKVKNEEDAKDEKKEDKKDDKKVENKEVKNEDKEDKEKVKDIKEEIKEDIDNKCKNSKEDESSFDKINAIYNSVKQIAQEQKFISRQEKLDNAVEYFK